MDKNGEMSPTFQGGLVLAIGLEMQTTALVESWVPSRLLTILSIIVQKHTQNILGYWAGGGLSP